MAIVKEDPKAAAYIFWQVSLNINYNKLWRFVYEIQIKTRVFIFFGFYVF